MNCCVIDGCDRPRKAHGYRMCSKHFHRWRKFGDPFAITKQEKGLCWSPSEADLLYIAGFFDGEGCVGAWFKKHPDGVTLRIDIANTDYDIIRWISEVAGDESYVHTGKARSLRHSVPYHFILNGVKAKDFVARIFPFLRVKREQARLFLTLFEFRDKSRYWTEESLNVVRQLKDLNKKGPS